MSEHTPEDVEAVAEFMFDRDHYGPWSETAHPDHNRWTWRGDGHAERYKDEWRETARAVLAFLGEHPEYVPGLMWEGGPSPTLIDDGPCDGRCGLVRCPPESRAQRAVWSVRRRIVGPWQAVPDGD